MEWIKAIAPVIAALIALFGAVYVVRRLEAYYRNVEKALQFRLRQVNEFYGPMLLLLEQSRLVYEKLKEVIRKNPELNIPPDDFRLLDHVSILVKFPKTKSFVRSILDIGKHMNELLRKKAGLIEGGLTQTYFDYVSHFEIINAIADAPQSEPILPGSQDSGYYPRALNREVINGYKRVVRRLDALLEGTDRTIMKLLKCKPGQDMRTFRQQLDNLYYYETHAKEYAQKFDQFDLSSLRKTFLDQLKAGKKSATESPAEEYPHILDAGCGTGRDTREFVKECCIVTAIDIAPTMVHECRLKIQKMKESDILSKEVKERAQASNCKEKAFDEIGYQDEFDGVWATASLVHTPKKEFIDILNKLTRSLKPNGVMFISVVYGHGEHEINGRHYSYYNSLELRRKIKKHKALELIRIWLTDSKTSELLFWQRFKLLAGLRKDRIWINIIVRKT